MECKKYNNALACRKYYEKNKDNPEFRLRKAYQARKQYYKKRYPIFWDIFQAWKTQSLKILQPVKKQIKKEVDKRININNFIIRRNRLLLKKVIDIWKMFEKTPRITKHIICSFF